jgi:hypothetical protein
VTDEGEKTKLPLGPTVTLTVIALAGLGYPMNETAIATTNTSRQEKILIAAPMLVNSATQTAKSDLLSNCSQFPKGNAAVTSDVS